MKYIPKGWKIESDVEPSKIKDFDFVSFLKKGEDYIGGTELQKRAEELNANLGMADAEYLLEHQNLIPAELQDKYLIFAGTVLRDSDGRFRVPCLYWDGGRWVLSFYWLVSGFSDLGRLARGKSLDFRTLLKTDKEVLNDIGYRLKVLEEKFDAVVNALTK